MPATNPPDEDHMHRPARAVGPDSGPPGHDPPLVVQKPIPHSPDHDFPLPPCQLGPAFLFSAQARTPAKTRRTTSADTRSSPLQPLSLCKDRDGHGSVSGPVASPFAMRYPTLGSLRMYVGLLASSPSLRRSCLAAVRTRRESPDLRRPQTRCRSRS